VRGEQCSFVEGFYGFLEVCFCVVESFCLIALMSFLWKLVFLEYFVLRIKTSPQDLSCPLIWSFDHSLRLNNKKDNQIGFKGGKFDSLWFDRNLIES
jgi:hypothetical protein